MTRSLQMKLILAIALVMPSFMFGGNPDRQGESGAYELLMNVWARSAGLNSLNTSSTSGVEAMRINVAGLSRISKGELVLANSRVFQGTGMSMTGGGLALRMGENGALGVSLTSLSFGDIPITTVNQPEGFGGSYSPNFFNLGLGYSYMYANKISVGLLVRGISEALPDVTAFGLAVDAGVQYVTGKNDNFRLGIALKNIGSPMQFGGQGLALAGNNNDNTQITYQLTYENRAEDFELPSTLDIGVSYDYYINEAKKDYIRGLANFTSNAFSRDQVGVGAEFSFREKVMLRASYKQNLGEGTSSFDNDVYTGLSAGATLMTSISKEGNKMVGIDYAYRPTNPFKGTHNISMRLSF